MEHAGIDMGTEDTCCTRGWGSQNLSGRFRFGPLHRAKQSDLLLNFMLDKSTSIEYHEAMMGNRLREVLKREGVTAYRLWKDLRIDQGQLSKFFHGKVNISLEMLEQIADYLGYDLVLAKRKRPRKGGK